MATADIFKWRLTADLTKIQRDLLIRYGIPTPSQIQYMDHAVKLTQSEGGIARHGYKSAEILWLKLDVCQTKAVVDFFVASKPINGGTGLLYATIKPLDGSRVEWMDIAGRPDLSDITPDAPVVGASGYIHSNITLKFNNVTVISENPTF